MEKDNIYFYKIKNYNNGYLTRYLTNFCIVVAYDSYSGDDLCAFIGFKGGRTVSMLKNKNSRPNFIKDPTFMLPGISPFDLKIIPSTLREYPKDSKTKKAINFAILFNEIQEITTLKLHEKLTNLLIEIDCG